MGRKSKRQDQPKPKQEPVKGKEDLKVSKAETASIEINPKSALTLFDSVFDPDHRSGQNPSSRVELPMPKTVERPIDTSKFSAFDSNEFWSSSTVNKPNGNANTKLSKSNVDFTSFDFWSQPPSKSGH
jgi:hypothetical protein